MKRITDFLIKRRFVILIVMLVLTAVSGVLAVRVPINRDRTKYLSDDSNMKQGISIMESAFPEAAEKASIRVMFDNLTTEQIVDVKAKLEAIPNVSSVTYEANNNDYNKDNHTLFVVNSKYDYNTEEEAAIEAALESGFPKFTMTFQNNDIPTTEVPIWLILVALTLAVIILVIMSPSWLDPMLFLITIGIAVVINFGTNIILPYIDEMTATVGPVLQLVLSMDYSVILMNRYRQEKQLHDDKVEAMKAALAGSLSSIASSSLTTVVGLLALVFLSFKLGPELGIVLSKGVFISMLCVFTILPALILATDKWLEKAKKRSLHIPVGRLASFSHKARYIMPAVFAVLLVGSMILQNSTHIVFTEGSEDSLAEIFPKENTVAVIYPTENEEKTGQIISELEKDERISSILGYSNTLGKEMNAEEMRDAIGKLSDGVKLDEDVVRMLYFIYQDGELPKLSVGNFLNFISDSVLPNETLSEYIDDTLRDNIGYLKKLSDKDRLTTEMTAKEMADFFGLKEEDTKNLYLYYSIQNGVSDSGTMTLPGFVDYVLNTVAKDETYGAMFDSESLSSLRHLQTYTDIDSVQKNRTASELASVLDIDEGTVKTVFMLHNTGDISGKTMRISDFSAFLCDHMLKDAIFSGSFDETAKAQAQTMNSLIRLAVSGQSLSSDRMAEALGMEEERISGLYYLYFSTDNAFRQEVSEKKMSVADFLVLMKANASAEQAAQLAQMEQLINLALSDQELDAAAMVSATGMTEDAVTGIYMMNSKDTMSLSEFLNSALQLSPDDPGLQQMNNIVQLTASGMAMDADTLASVFGIETAQVHQLFGLALSRQKTVPLADFTDFLVHSVLTNDAYAGNFTEQQAAQLQQMNQIVQLAVSETQLDASALAQIFGMDEALIKTVVRLYYGADISNKTMSLKSFTDFILSDPLIKSRMDSESLSRLRFLQSIIHASVNKTKFTSKELASLLGMDASQTEQLYILHMSDPASQKLTPQSFVAFAAENILDNEDFADYFDRQAVDELRLGHTLIEAVVSGKEYSAVEMSDLFTSMTQEVSENEIEVMYLYYGGLNDTDSETRLTIPQLLAFLTDDMLNDKRFTDFFDENTKAEIRSSESEMKSATSQMSGETYSRLVLTSDYPYESPETEEYITKVKSLCENNLGEYYLVGNSVMVSEMSETFDREYIMITLITAVAIFLVVLLAFHKPILPLILTLVVQCGVFITVTIIGAYSGSVYYLALLIVQSILMGATIDYGIVFCNFYRESRKKMDGKESLKAAYKGSIQTIMTSGSILVLVLACLGIFTSSPMISEVCVTLSIGALVAILLILFVLPGLVICCDKLIHKEKRQF